MKTDESREAFIQRYAKGMLRAGLLIREGLLTDLSFCCERYASQANRSLNISVRQRSIGATGI